MTARLRQVWLRSAWVLCLGCGDSSDASDESGPSEDTGAVSTSTGAAATETTAAPDSTGGAGESTAGEGSSSAGSSTGDGTAGFVEPVCGDGLVEGDEECDDRNDEPDDGCDNLCNASGVAEWTTTWNGPDDADDTAAGVAIAPDGAVWIAGSAVTDGVSVAFLHRYAPGGALELELPLDDGTDQTVRDLTIDGEGFLYLAGAGGGDAWVARYDDGGAQQWRYDRDTKGYVEISATAVAVGPSGTWACGVERDDEGDAGLDAWLVRLDDAGAVAWEERVPGEPEEDAYAFGIAEVGPGSVVVGGGQTRPGSGLDAWLRRYDADGEVVWTVFEAGDEDFTDQRVRDLAVDPRGEIVVTGVREVGTDQLVWTRRYAADGTEVWTRTWGGPGMITGGGRSVALTDAGDVIITGEVGIRGDGTNIFVRRYTADGNFEQWTSFYGGEAMLNDLGLSVAAAPDGSIYASGQTTVLGQGNDVWLRKLAGN